MIATDSRVNYVPPRCPTSVANPFLHNLENDCPFSIVVASRALSDRFFVIAPVLEVGTPAPWNPRSLAHRYHHDQSESMNSPFTALYSSETAQHGSSPARLQAAARTSGLGHFFPHWQPISVLRGLRTSRFHNADNHEGERYFSVCGRPKVHHDRAPESCYIRRPGYCLSRATRAAAQALRGPGAGLSPPRAAIYCGSRNPLFRAGRHSFHRRDGEVLGQGAETNRLPRLINRRIPWQDNLWAGRERVSKKGGGIACNPALTGHKH